MMQMRSTRWTVLALCSLLAACSSDEVIKPHDLVPLPVHPAWLGEQWSRSVGNGAADEFLRLQPAVGEVAVFAASHNGVVNAINKASGERLWRKRTKLPFSSGLTVGYGMVLGGTDKGEVVALSAGSGDVLWRAALSAAVLAAPALSAEQVIVQSSDGKVYALDRHNGTRLWTHDTVVPALSLRGNAPPLLVSDVVFVATAGGRIEALQAADGAPAWQVRVASNQGRSELERMTDIDGDMLFDAGSKTLFAVGFQSQLGAVNASEGRRLWQYDVSSYRSLASANGAVFVSAADGSVYAIDAESGKSLWRQQLLTGRGLSGPLVFAGMLVVGDSDGYLHLLRLADGSLLGRVYAGGGQVLSLTADSSTAYVYSGNGRLSAWQPAIEGPNPKRLAKPGFSGWR